MELAKREERVIPYPLLGTSYREQHGFEKERALEEVGKGYLKYMGLSPMNVRVLQNTDVRREYLLVPADKELGRLPLEQILQWTVTPVPARAYRAIVTQNT